MFFYRQEQTKGMVPTSTQRDEKWTLVPKRVAIALLIIVILAVIYFVLRGRPDYAALASLVRTLGEILVGAVAGVLISEQQAAKVINIYVTERKSSDRRDGT